MDKFNIVIGDLHIIAPRPETHRLLYFMYESGLKPYEVHEQEKTIEFTFYRDINLI